MKGRSAIQHCEIVLTFSFISRSDLNETLTYFWSDQPRFVDFLLSEPEESQRSRTDTNMTVEG